MNGVVYVVGWAQDLDDWGLYSAHATEQGAKDAAEAIALEKHFDAWAYRGPSAALIREWHGRNDWDCCRPRVIRVEVAA